MDSRANGHGVSPNTTNGSRCRQDRFPHPCPPPKGEGDWERATRDLHRKQVRRARVVASSLVVALATSAGASMGAVVAAPDVNDQPGLPPLASEGSNPAILIGREGLASDWRSSQDCITPLPVTAHRQGTGASRVTGPATIQQPALHLGQPSESPCLRFAKHHSIWHGLGHETDLGAAQDIYLNVDPVVVQSAFQPYLSGLARSASRVPGVLPMFVAALAFAATFSILRRR